MASLMLRLQDTHRLLLRNLAELRVLVSDEGSARITHEKADLHGVTGIFRGFAAGTYTYRNRLRVFQYDILSHFKRDHLLGCN